MDCTTISAAGFRQFFEASPALQIVLTPDFRIVAATDAYLEAAMSRRDDLVGEIVFEAFPDDPDEPEASGVRNLRASLEAVVARRAPDRMLLQRYDVRRPPERGGGFEVRYGEPLNLPVLDDAGAVAFIIHPVEDATELVTLRERQAEQDRTEAALRASNEWFSTTLGSIGDAVIATDAAGSILFMNPVAERLCGWSDRQAAGKPLETVFRIVHEQSRRPAESLVARAIARGGVVGLANRTILIARDGTEHPIEDSAAPIRNAGGGIEGVVLFFRDATNRVRIENALGAARQRLQDALSAGSIATYSWDMARDHVAGDANMVRFYSIAPERSAGGPAEDYIAAIHPDDRERIRRTIGATIESGKPFDVGYRICQGEDPIRWVVGRGALTRDDRGRPATMNGVIVDITERKRIEEQVRHLPHLIDDLLDVSRITQGKIELKPQTIEVAAVVARAVELVRPLVAEKGHELTVTQPGGAVRFVADPTRTGQILGNLLTNNPTSSCSTSGCPG